ncbi:DUF4127 family protein [Agromyces sp. CFH 90414]|uniref:DUF4127 family protein n=1 Tax=Agromyces agglutinans TaxID=2662258 RepID=A0A6I2FDZ6_9MICO|nr:DUF4127 family protein [Agromyces agglutinans]MRG60736.1 DUF4127 family protein [Agromyces agglutinans]
MNEAATATGPSHAPAGRQRILLVPLDERPVSSELPGLVAAIAGAAVELPPASGRPRLREAGDADLVAEWLRTAATGADGVVVSLDALGFGGLIPSRIGTEPIEAVLARWSVLRGLDVPVHAAVVVPRSPDADDAFEEPDYWERWGRALHALSTELGDSGGPAHAASATVRPGETASASPTIEIPADVRADWLARRLRQHALALSALGLAADGSIDRLFVGVDDAVPGSLSAAAQGDLATWAGRLDLGDRVVVGPGADETATVLTTRLIADRAGGGAIRVAVVCAEPDGLERIAPYETGAVGETARTQLRAAGAVPVREGDDHDAVLVVHAPAGAGAGDWAVAPPATTDASAAGRTVALVRAHLDAGRSVAVADTAQPNGADPELVRALLADGAYWRLDGFAAWNTAGNTLGTVAGHLVVATAARGAGSYDAAAAERHLRLRLIEDYAYMSFARARLRSELASRADRHDRLDDVDAAAARAAQLMTEALAALPGAGPALEVAAADVSFPWRRTFEVRLRSTAGER